MQEGDGFQLWIKRLKSIIDTHHVALLCKLVPFYSRSNTAHVKTFQNRESRKKPKIGLTKRSKRLFHWRTDSVNILLYYWFHLFLYNSSVIHMNTCTAPDKINCIGSMITQSWVLKSLKANTVVLYIAMVIIREHMLWEFLLCCFFHPFIKCSINPKIFGRFSLNINHV